MGILGVMANLPHCGSGFGGHPTTTQSCRTSGQADPAGPCLEDVITGNVRIRTAKARKKAYRSPKRARMEDP